MKQKQRLKLLYHCSYSLQYHLVLVTKYRRRCLDAEILERLREIFESTITKWEGELSQFNGEAEHIHALISLNPKTAPSKFVNNLKTVSSRLIRQEFKAKLDRIYDKPVFWSRTYCIISCGGAPLSVLKQYIEQQETPD